jgi:hypothetical protein
MVADGGQDLDYHSAQSTNSVGFSGQVRSPSGFRRRSWLGRSRHQDLFQPIAAAAPELALLIPFWLFFVALSLPGQSTFFCFQQMISHWGLLTQVCQRRVLCRTTFVSLALPPLLTVYLRLWPRNATDSEQVLTICKTRPHIKWPRYCAYRAFPKTKPNKSQHDISARCPLMGLAFRNRVRYLSPMAFGHIRRHRDSKKSVHSQYFFS